MDAFSVFLTIWRIAGLWAAALVFALPLRRPAGPRAWMLPGIAACIAVRAALWLMLAGFPARLWLYDIASYLLVAAAVALCTDISRAAVLYAAVWAMVLYYVGDSLAITAAHAVSGAGGGPLPMTLAALATAAAAMRAPAAAVVRKERGGAVFKEGGCCLGAGARGGSDERDSGRRRSPSRSLGGRRGAGLGWAVGWVSAQSKRFASFF